MLDLDVRRILVCLRFGIGDVVMELPALVSLRRALPETHVTALGAFPATQLLERSSLVDDIVQLDDWGFRHRWDPGPPGVANEIAGWLDEKNFQAFHDVAHVTPAFGAVVWGRGVRSIEASEAAERAAVGRGETGVAAIRAAVEEGWGLSIPPDVEPHITPGDEDREFAGEFFRRHGIDSFRPLALSPVASLDLKRWPVERLAAIVSEVADQGEPLLIFTGPQAGVGERLIRFLPPAFRPIPIGALHLLKVAAILERCRLFACNDTGLMHVASAVGVPTLAIFGPTRAAIYRPVSRWTVAIEARSVVCPYRDTASLRPPACFTEGRCLTANGPCIRMVTEEEVRRGFVQLEAIVGGMRAHSAA